MWRRRRRWVCGGLVGSGGLISAAWASTVMVVTDEVTAVPLPDVALGRLIGCLRALGDGPAERGGIDRAIGHGDDGADLRQVGVVEHERLVLGGDAIEDAVGLGAGQQRGSDYPPPGR